MTGVRRGGDVALVAQRVVAALDRLPAGIPGEVVPPESGAAAEVQRDFENAVVQALID